MSITLPEQQFDERHEDAIAEGLTDLEHGDFSDYDTQELRDFFGTLSERSQVLKTTAPSPSRL